MGGSGDAGRYRISPRELDEIREEARKRLERSRVDAEVNTALQRELVSINDRDVDAIRSHLDEIEACLGDRIEEFDRLLLGGSVAKHTYVDGLSDIDSLVVFKGEGVGDESPADVRDDLRATLRAGLDPANVTDIVVGNLAVTVGYTDGSEIQLLPAVQKGDDQAIASPSGEAWARIRPKEFVEQLTAVNAEQGGGVVPAIKLAKSILANALPEELRPSGYHVEALAVKAFQNYEGPRTPKAMVQRFFDAATDEVLSPRSDVTGQSRYIDEDLGPENSPVRRTLSRRLGHIAEEMRTTSSVDAWKRLLGEESS